MHSLQGHLLIASPALADPNFARSIVLMVEHNAQGALGLVLNRPSQTTIRQAWQQVNPSHCPSRGFVHVGGPCEGPLMVIHTYKDKAQIAVLPPTTAKPGIPGKPAAGLPGTGLPNTKLPGAKFPGAKLSGMGLPGVGAEIPGVYFSTDQESVEWLVQNAATPIKFFVGYAGWSAGQLESEIAAGGWITAPADPATIFAGGDTQNTDDFKPAGAPGGDSGGASGGGGGGASEGEDQWFAAIRILSLQPHLRGLNPKIIPDDPSVN